MTTLCEQFQERIDDINKELELQNLEMEVQCTWMTNLHNRLHRVEAVLNMYEPTAEESEEWELATVVTDPLNEK